MIIILINNNTNMNTNQMNVKHAFFVYLIIIINVVASKLISINLFVIIIIHGFLHASCLEHFFNLWYHRIRIYSWMHKSFNLPIRSNQKLGEIPRDLQSFPCFFIMQFRVKSQKLINFAAVFAIHFDFIENRKIHIEISLCVFLDLRVVPWFLPHELVCREG